jgi:adenine phosphoribosyltransferase
VVIFDRVKDNAHTLGQPGRRTILELVNVSLNEVVYRSVNTTISSILPVGALLFIGGQVLGATTLQDLALALFIGLIAGRVLLAVRRGPLYAHWKAREPAEQRRIAKVAARAAGARRRRSRRSKPRTPVAHRSRPTMSAAVVAADVDAADAARHHRGPGPEGWTDDHHRPCPARVAHPRRPGLPQARHRLQGRHAAARRSRAFAHAVEVMSAAFCDEGIDKVVGIEARGFILAAPVALACGAGFVPARKAGKLPASVARVSYELEYGSETIELHDDAFAPGDRVLIVDDVLATGGTAAATVELVESLGGEVVGLTFLIELGFLGAVHATRRTSPPVTADLLSHPAVPGPGGPPEVGRGRAVGRLVRRTEAVRWRSDPLPGGPGDPAGCPVGAAPLERSPSRRAHPGSRACSLGSRWDRARSVPPELEELAAAIRRESRAELREVIRAYHYARAMHEGQKRRSGEDYITHPVAVATNGSRRSASAPRRCSPRCFTTRSRTRRRPSRTSAKDSATRSRCSSMG